MFFVFLACTLGSTCNCYAPSSGWITKVPGSTTIRDALYNEHEMGHKFLFSLKIGDQLV